ncbi:MAG: hypothetical protein IJC64_00810 [Clostridia bacterium]|nr:hypothetical protein [Clostridia bacterium]
MGFGLLMIGYIISHVASIGFGTYTFAATLIGGFVMFLGLTELRRYAPTFVYAIIANTLLLICSFYGTLVWIETQFFVDMGIVASGLGNFFGWAEIIIRLLLNLSMLYGIADLSLRVDYPDTRIKAYRNMIFVLLFNALQIMLALPISALDGARAGLMMILLILQLVYTVFNTALIFKCYAMICPEGQEDMQRKPSRFEFINKWNKVRDAREEQVEQETKKYFEDKLRRRNGKLNKNKHTTKKKK